ncbi:MAG: hypothetical protein M0Q42_00290 [Xanthomonadales bacterium]|nr:hypothetical protein [Xanthomonadales bacterium]
MNQLPVLHHGGRWLAFKGRHRRELEAGPDLDQAARVMAEMSGAISAVTTVKGARGHVAAQIEKRLREDGLTDGESQVIVHHVERLAGACRVFYTACPAASLQSLLGWAQAQADHCLVFLPESVLWQGLAPGQGVVARIGRQLCFVGRHGRQPLYARAMALSDAAEEQQAAAALLGRRVAGQLAALGSRLSLRWLVIDAAAASAEAGKVEEGLLIDAFASACGERVEHGRHDNFIDGSQSLDSALPRLLAQAPARLALNTGLARISAGAERTLPWLAAAAVLAAVVLAGLAGWQGQQRGQLDAELARLNQDAGQIQQQLAVLADDSQIPPGLNPTLEFLDQVAQVEARIAPLPVLAAIGQASDAALAILRVRSDATVGAVPGSIVVEGRLLAQDGDRHLARFVQHLRLAGYQPTPVDALASGGGQQPAGFFAYLLQPALANGFGEEP